MTDATHAVTQSALEIFTKAYLTGLGASIRENKDRWSVRLPNHVDVDFVEETEFEMMLSDQGATKDDSVHLLTPESEFAQHLLDEAAEMAPTGQIALTKETTDSNYAHPSWITESSAEVAEATFNPYYDRTAVSVFVSIGVETVSEYQTQFLEAVTIDIQSRDQLPGLTSLLVSDYFTPGGDQISQPAGESLKDESAIPSEKLIEAISDSQKAAENEVIEELQDIRQSASRAATSEFEEYQQLQEQRINDLQNEISSLTDRLQRLATEVDEAGSQRQRVEALERRKEVKTEIEALESELAEIVQEKEQGYSTKQREILDRHAINVNTKPVALTLVSYERGEIEFSLSEAGKQQTIRVPYAIGGVTDEVNCENCSKTLSEKNPIHLKEERIGCQDCC